MKRKLLMSVVVMMLLAIGISESANAGPWRGGRGGHWGGRWGGGGYYGRFYAPRPRVFVPAPPIVVGPSYGYGYGYGQGYYGGGYRHGYYGGRGYYGRGRGRYRGW